jgi:hypothetical protein
VLTIKGVPDLYFLDMSLIDLDVLELDFLTIGITRHGHEKL